MRSLRILLLLGAVLAAGPAFADGVAVAVAANFTAPMRKIAAEFERDTGHQVQLSFGSAGKFYAQIKAGAPFELLLSADQRVPLELVAQGLALAESRQTYAIGKLVLWSADPALVDAKGEVLRSQRFSHLAIANPKLAPYGAAAQQVLQQLGLAETLQPRLVEGENITQTHQFVATGNAQLGFVAWSQVIGDDGKVASGSAWMVPAGLHAPIRQDLVLLERGRGKPAAQALAAYVLSDKGRKVILDYGYSLERSPP